MGFANFLKEIKYFGTKDPIGQSLLMDNDTELIVTGILKDIPSNSHLRFDFLASGMMAVFVAMLTVCIKIVRTAYANPVDSLRYETGSTLIDLK
jgi:hypothetical protein